MTTTNPPDIMVGNILRVYREATPDQYARGASWYPDAHTFALSLDSADVERAAGVIAALSPQTPWSRNVTLAARAFVEGHASGTLGASIAAADRILSGEHWSTVLRGPKVRAFAATIADPTTPDVVVVDRHAVSIALGAPGHPDAVKTLNRKGGYTRVAFAYQVAAGIVGTSPSVMQAVTWTVWRETRIRTAAAARREAAAGNVPAVRVA